MCWLCICLQQLWAIRALVVPTLAAMGTASIMLSAKNAQECVLNSVASAWRRARRWRS